MKTRTLLATVVVMLIVAPSLATAQQTLVGALAELWPSTPAAPAMAGSQLRHGLGRHAKGLERVRLRLSARGYLSRMWGSCGGVRARCPKRRRLVLRLAYPRSGGEWSGASVRKSWWALVPDSRIAVQP